MMADEVSIEFVSRQLDRVLTEMRGLRQDIDMLTRIVLRLDSTVDALRADVKTLWLSQGDLRRRIDALEARQ
jgi:prefoldin subunit 5